MSDKIVSISSNVVVTPPASGMIQSKEVLTAAIEQLKVVESLLRAANASHRGPGPGFMGAEYTFPTELNSAIGSVREAQWKISQFLDKYKPTTIPTNDQE